MANLADARCTCPAFWRGNGKRPECVRHEAPGALAEELPPGKARRSDGQVVDVLATIGGPARRPGDPEGMPGTWRPWP